MSRLSSIACGISILAATASAAPLAAGSTTNKAVIQIEINGAPQGGNPNGGRGGTFRLRSGGRTTDKGTRALAGTAVSDVHAAASAKAFTSARFHYSLTVPTSWKIVPATTDPLPGVFPAADGPETDRFNAPHVTPTPELIGVAAENLPAAATVQTWTRKVIAELHADFGCANPARKTRVLAGETTNELIYTGCTGSYFIVLATVHHRRGYDVFWLSPWVKDGSTYAADRATFDHILTTFRFTS